MLAVPHHPLPDEKCVAESLTSCGGGPAANAAVSVARLGGRAAFAGYLGNNFFGNQHFNELQSAEVITDLIVRGNHPTPLSIVLVKSNGDRTVINYRPSNQYLKKGEIDFSHVHPKVILFDGHEPDLSIPLAKQARIQKIPTILDAGSVHHGTKKLIDIVDYTICSEKFAADFTNNTNMEKALDTLHRHCQNVVITLGGKGLLWKREKDCGHFPAMKIKAVDTTGAGDTFHGAFSYCVAIGKSWEETLLFSSAAAALCCTKMGARKGIPDKYELEQLLKNRSHD